MRTLLLADDNGPIREHCRAALEDEGYRVIEARDGAEALGACEEVQPDLVVLDICMPRMSGLDALERLKSTAPDLPVILFTAFDDDCLRDERGRLATACVEKSDDLTDLKRTICRLLDVNAGDRTQEPLRLGLPPDPCVAGSRQRHAPEGATE